MLLWFASEENVIPGNPLNEEGSEATSDLYYSFYDGEKWSEPEVVITGLGPVADSSLVYEDGKGLFVLAMSNENNLHAASMNLYAVSYSREDGWDDELQPLTGNNEEGANNEGGENNGQRQYTI